MTFSFHFHAISKFKPKSILFYTELDFCSFDIPLDSVALKLNKLVYMKRIILLLFPACPEKVLS